jgi:hypothetical protein
MKKMQMAAKLHEDMIKAHSRVDHLISKDETETQAAQASVSAKIKNDISAIH